MIIQNGKTWRPLQHLVFEDIQYTTMKRNINAIIVAFYAVLNLVSKRAWTERDMTDAGKREVIVIWSLIESSAKAAQAESAVEENFFW